MPRLAVVLGTGLGGLTDRLDNPLAVDFDEIPGLPPARVDGHVGRLWAGVLQGVDVWVQQGRLHFYEGHSPATVCLPVRALAGLGVATLVLTCAAGALNPAFRAGRLMCVADHLNMTGQSPFAGPYEPSWGPRFPDMSRVWSPRLLHAALEAAAELGLEVETGVYAGVAGPQLETPAETRALRALGADAVGMSMVLEAAAARAMGLEVAGVCCLTNKNDPDDMAPILHEQVVDQAGRLQADLADLVAGLLQRL